ncbi:MAG: DUF6029 family protein [Alistipes sp.]|jgi:hypothetical protein|nr:DUF6029 family protein [Alistipes sp.]
MKTALKHIFTATAVLSLLAAAESASAQDQQQERDYGRLSGSFETNTIQYVPDRDVATPTDRFGSNNYLKLDYSIGGFTAGAQAELYAPVLQGFNPNLQKSRITNKFVGWSDGKFNVTVGDFYEQFGSGIALRSWEDRALGFNNSLEGVRAGFSNDYVTVKGVYARPRMFMGYTDTWVRGGDVSLSVGRLLGMQNHYLALEGSYVNRFMGGYAADSSITVDPGMNIYSGRLVLDLDFGLSIKGEYVGKGDDRHMDDGQWKAMKGNAQLIEIGYSGNGLGIFFTGRRLERAGTKIDAADGSEANTMNYLPSLTRQYTYSLATLDPYSTDMDDEMGGQLDVFYTFKRGSKLGGKYGTRVHANVSTFYPLEKRGAKMYPMYRDVSFDLEKQWNRKVKTTLLYAVQTFSPNNGVTATTEVHNVFVADVLYKFTTRNSLRVEAQYLYSKENTDWWAATAEFNLAPRWSFFVSDMYNHGAEKVHYYNAGVSFTQSRTRLAVSYGRNREGYVCSGGVCRLMPAYTGANISLTTSF